MVEPEKHERHTYEHNRCLHGIGIHHTLYSSGYDICCYDKSKNQQSHIEIDIEYLFNEYGNPVYGLRKVRRSNGQITSMYFGTKQQSCLQKGDRSITDAEGNNYTFYFDSSGYGYTGVKNGRLYYMGLLQRAVDTSYAYYTVNGETYLVNKSGVIRKNYNSNKEEADYKSDSQGRWMEGAYEEPSELLTPVFEVSYI